jgi:hypothetical protein
LVRIRLTAPDGELSDFFLIVSRQNRFMFFLHDVADPFAVITEQVVYPNDAHQVARTIGNKYRICAIVETDPKSFDNLLDRCVEVHPRDVGHHMGGCRFAMVPVVDLAVFWHWRSLKR